MSRILIVEDDRDLAFGLSDDLQVEGYEVEVVSDGESAIKRAREDQWDLILLDIMLPHKDGFEVCRHLRRSGIRTPIIMLTARAQEAEKILGLELGADDYITKPFNPRELVARVRAVLRRSDAAPAAAPLPQDTTLVLDGLRVEVGGREVYVHDEGVALTPKEFDLLVTLLENRGLVMTRQQLLERVWGFTFLGDSRTIDVHVRQLRRKLGEQCPIQTVWGTGYKVPAASR